MKRFPMLALAAIALTIGGPLVSAEEFIYSPLNGPTLAPIPEPGTPTPVVSPTPVIIQDAPPVVLQKPGIDPVPLGIAPLYTKVEYDDLRHIPHNAVEKIVPVKLECKCKGKCCCLGEICVFVRICVPPCKCEEIKVSRRGRKVTYDYGDFEVEIRAKGNVVHVDYDD